MFLLERIQLAFTLPPYHKQEVGASKELFPFEKSLEKNIKCVQRKILTEKQQEKQHLLQPSEFLKNLNA